MERLKFPDGFLWGSATSAHQVEGNNHNDWSEWESSPARIEQLKKEGKNPPDFVSGQACDSYNRYEEDFDIAKELNHNVHRFSIEWSRIEPEEGKFNEEAIEHYKKVIDALRARGMTPLVTLWHFTNPIWFSDKGGFLNSNSPQIFTRYINYVVDKLKDRVGWWITFNEATSVWSSMSYLLGYWPPQEKSFFKLIKVQNNFIEAHTLAYHAIHKIYKEGVVPQSDGSSGDTSHNVRPRVGAVENFSLIVTNPFLKLIGVAALVDYIRNTRFFSQTTPYQDFIGLNYYTIRRLADGFGSLAKQDVADEMNWEIYPKGIYEALKAYWKYQKPIIITENGIGDRTDTKREKFIKEHLREVHRAIENGVDVRGYCYWSLLDNFEWAEGYRPRFGLVEVDYATQKRTIRPSAREYAKICAQNELEI